MMTLKRRKKTLRNPSFGKVSFYVFTQSGVDVTITILGEKIGVFLKNECYDQNFS
jgi:hypothetical protein